MPPFNLIIERSITTFVLVGLVFLVGRDMLRSMRRKGQHLRAYHGWFVRVWMVAGSFLGMAVAAVVGPTPVYGASAFFISGLLGGWVIGMIHGSLMLAFVGPSSPTPASDPDADLLP